MSGDASDTVTPRSYNPLPVHVLERRASPSPLRDQVHDLAARVDRLTVHRRDPERFFEERSEIAAQLRALARRVGGAA